MSFTVGSLFAGIGGFDLGFERAGFDVVWQVEIDPWARKVLAKNFPGAERYGDIRECGAHNLKPVDVVVGGFPCQDISNAGLRAGITGERSGLWREMVRTLCVVRPRVALVENVAALLGRGMGTVLGDLSEVGANAEWDCVSARDVGAPHLRERIWIMAHPVLDGLGSPELREFRAPDASEPAWPNRVGEAGGRGAYVGPFLADTPSARCSEGIPGESGQVWDEAWGTEPERRGSDVADALGFGRVQGRSDDREHDGAIAAADGEHTGEVSHTGCQGLSIAQQTAVFGKGGRDEGGATPECGWWAVEPNVGRVAHGVPARVDRLRGLGNAVVPYIPEMYARRIRHLLETQQINSRKGA